MSAKLVRHIKVIEDTGNIVEIKMWQVNPRADRPAWIQTLSCLYSEWKKSYRLR